MKAISTILFMNAIAIDRTLNLETNKMADTIQVLFMMVLTLRRLCGNGVHASGLPNCASNALLEAKSDQDYLGVYNKLYQKHE